MRSLLLCVLLLLTGLAFLYVTDSSAPNKNWQAATVPPRKTVGERGSPGMAGVPARRDAASRSEMGGSAEASGEEASEAPVEWSRLRVEVRPKDVAFDRQRLDGLRVQARSLRSGARYEAAVHVSVAATTGLVECRASIEIPGGDRYRVSMDPESVPEGYLASGAYALGALDSSGIAGAFVEVGEKTEADVTLWIFGTSSLSGWVSGAGGVALGGVTVRAQGIAPGMAGLSHDAVTAPDGSFEFLELLPVIYGVNVVDLGIHDDEWAGWSWPPRQLFDLGHGACFGVEVRMGAGPITVSGRVVDELGIPFEQVSVRAYYAGDEAHSVALDFERTFTWSDHALHVRTDESGRFQLRGLKGVPIRVQVGAEEAANGPERRARFVPAPVDVPLGRTSPSTVSLGDLVLERSRRFVVRGRIFLTLEELDGKRLRQSRLEVLGVPYPLDDMDPPWPGRETRPRVDHDRRTGTFTLSCEAEQPLCSVTVALRGHPETAKEFSWVPANETGLASALTDRILAFP